MKIFAEISEIRLNRWDEPLLTWGLVPTMGSLHEGHLSLVRLARKKNDRVGVSIFVNPAQFNNSDDLAKYPRTLDRDLTLLEQEGVDLVWTPTPDIVYPSDFQTFIELERVTSPLEGASRPGHFRGVATVVAKLFNIFEPQNVYFGQKDAQQVVVIRQMVRDLNFNLNIVVGPTVREPDGLAMSSRNANLFGAARQQATCLYRALIAGKSAYSKGQRNVNQIRAIMSEVIAEVELAQIDYISIAHPETLEELDRIDDKALLSLAIFIDGVRLIDNMIIG